jgi:hypothetical protein
MRWIHSLSLLSAIPTVLGGSDEKWADEDVLKFVDPLIGSVNGGMFPEKALSSSQTI